MPNNSSSSDASGSPSSPAPTGGTTVSPSDKRAHLRFDKVFPVRVESILFGQLHCVARNVSAGGIFLETTDPLPLGARLRVCFLTTDEASEIAAEGEVKNHYFVNFVQDGVSRSISGMAVRFLSFDEGSQQVLRNCLNRFRILH
jgi:hypothetical protein